MERQFFAITILAAFTLTPLAVADETTPECGPSTWPTGPAHSTVRDTAGLAGIKACEGEHWDGQDPISPDGAGADPNDAPSDSLAQPASVYAARRPDLAGSYVSFNLVAVGRAAVYTGTCNGGDLCVAVYYRDNTPTNLVWTMTQSPSITGPPVAESDCDQQTYDDSVESHDRHRCPRDNTASTVQVTLP